MDRIDRIIETNLTSSKAFDICDSVIAQMFDGYWANDPHMEGYWRFAKATRVKKGTVAFLINGHYNKTYFNQDRVYYNRFFRMRDSEVLAFFAKKIKFILQKELKECFGLKLNEKTIKDKSIKVCWLTKAYYNNKITVKDVDDVIRSLEASAIATGIAESSVD